MVDPSTLRWYEMVVAVCDLLLCLSVSVFVFGQMASDVLKYLARKFCSTGYGNRLCRWMGVRYVECEDE